MLILSLQKSLSKTSAASETARAPEPKVCWHMLPELIPG